MKKTFAIALLPLAALALSACTTGIGGTDYDKAHADVVAASFQPNGIATLDYLKQDEANRLCSAADVAGKPVYLGLAMDGDNVLRLKPQNLLLNLPLAGRS